jgi:hypothetical protein
MAQSSSPHGQQQRYVLPMMALNLCTGTALQLLAQYVTDLVTHDSSNMPNRLKDCLQRINLSFSSIACKYDTILTWLCWGRLRALQDIADGRVQALAYAKYVFMLAATTLQQWRVRENMQNNGKKTDDIASAEAPRKLSKRALRLMTVIGLLDLVSYLLHCVGKYHSCLFPGYACSCWHPGTV